MQSGVLFTPDLSGSTQNVFICLLGLCYSKILLRYITLVINTVNISCYSREHTEIACICRAVICIGAAHMTFLTVEIKI